MAFLVRPSKTFYIDRHGRRVPKGTWGAKKVREFASKWYGEGIPGQHPKKRVPLSVDRAAAQRLLDDLVRRAERGRAGLPDTAAGRAPFAVLLDRFEDDLALGLASAAGRRRSRPPSASQVALTVQRVRNLLDGCGFSTPADLDARAPAKLARYLQDRAASEKRAGGLSHQSAAFYLASARRFVRWLAARDVPVRADLFDGIPGFDPRNHRVHDRREIRPDELAALLAAARASAKVYRGLAGEDRYHLYLTAFATGYRAGEIAVLRPDCFDLEGPTVGLPGRFTKGKRAARLPLPPGVASQLRSYLTGRPPEKPVWPGTWVDRPVAVLRRDLAAAGVPYKVDSLAGPLFADFHALRHSFLSALAAAGAGVKELQELARHSDPRLTIGVYTHARPEAVAAAVGRLQLPGGPPPTASLAGLSRGEVEGIAVGMLAALETILGGLVTGPVTATVPSGTDNQRQNQEMTSSGPTAERRGKLGKTS